MEDKDLFILKSSKPWLLKTGNYRNQGISSHGIALVSYHIIVQLQHNKS